MPSISFDSATVRESSHETLLQIYLRLESGRVWVPGVGYALDDEPVYDDRGNMIANNGRPVYGKPSFKQYKHQYSKVKTKGEYVLWSISGGPLNRLDWKIVYKGLIIWSSYGRGNGKPGGEFECFGKKLFDDIDGTKAWKLQRPDVFKRFNL
jgi:hypothetical protein